MVDMNMYWEMHPEESSSRSTGDDLGQDAMTKEQPPDEDFLFLMPPTITGFGLHDKVWSKYDSPE